VTFDVLFTARTKRTKIVRFSQGSVTSHYPNPELLLFATDGADTEGCRALSCGERLRRPDYRF
jgi:hypothetical protein